MNKNNKPKLSRASVVRLMACQALCIYNSNLNNEHDLNEILENINDYYIKETFKSEDSTTNYYELLYKTDFLHNMLIAVIKSKDKINELLELEIRNYNNTVDNLLDTTRECFRLAIYEMQNLAEVPTEVIINEYVDIIAEFTNDENETKFANRVLENLAIKLRSKPEKKNIINESNKKQSHRKIISLKNNN